jgi:hypothetical protein
VSSLAKKVGQLNQAGDMRRIFCAQAGLRLRYYLTRFLKHSPTRIRYRFTPLAACFFLATSNADAQSSAYFGRTNDPTPVDVSIQDKTEIVHFKIPKVFMTFSRNWDGGLQSGITLAISYPSMTALSAATNNTLRADVVVVSLESYSGTGVDYSMSQKTPYFIAKQWAFIGNVVDGNGRSYGYYVNKGDIGKINEKSDLLTEFFIPDNSSDTYFECFREPSNPFVGCGGFSTYGQTLTLHYQFRRTQFEKWPGIRDAVVKLLNGFRSPQ